MRHWESGGSLLLLPQINLTMAQPPTCGFLEYFPCDPVKEHNFHQQEMLDSFFSHSILFGKNLIDPAVGAGSFLF